MGIKSRDLNNIAMPKARKRSKPVFESCKEEYQRDRASDAVYRNARGSLEFANIVLDAILGPDSDFEDLKPFDEFRIWNLIREKLGISETELSRNRQVTPARIEKFLRWLSFDALHPLDSETLDMPCWDYMVKKQPAFQQRVTIDEKGKKHYQFYLADGLTYQRMVDEMLQGRDFPVGNPRATGETGTNIDWFITGNLPNSFMGADDRTTHVEIKSVILRPMAAGDSNYQDSFMMSMSMITAIAASGEPFATAGGKNGYAAMLAQHLTEEDGTTHRTVRIDINTEGKNLALRVGPNNTLEIFDPRRPDEVLAQVPESEQLLRLNKIERLLVPLYRLDALGENARVENTIYYENLRLDRYRQLLASGDIALQLDENGLHLHVRKRSLDDLYERGPFYSRDENLSKLPVAELDKTTQDSYDRICHRMKEKRRIILEAGGNLANDPIAQLRLSYPELDLDGLIPKVQSLKTIVNNGEYSLAQNKIRKDFKLSQNQWGKILSKLPFDTGRRIEENKKLAMFQRYYAGDSEEQLAADFGFKNAESAKVSIDKYRRSFGLPSRSRSHENYDLQELILKLPEIIGTDSTGRQEEALRKVAQRQERITSPDPKVRIETLYPQVNYDDFINRITTASQGSQNEYSKVKTQLASQYSLGSGQWERIMQELDKNDMKPSNPFAPDPQRDYKLLLEYYSGSSMKTVSDRCKFSEPKYARKAILKLRKIHNLPAVGDCDTNGIVEQLSQSLGVSGSSEDIAVIRRRNIEEERNRPVPVPPTPRELLEKLDDKERNMVMDYWAYEPLKDMASKYKTTEKRLRSTMMTLRRKLGQQPRGAWVPKFVSPPEECRTLPDKELLERLSATTQGFMNSPETKAKKAAAIRKTGLADRKYDYDAIADDIRNGWQPLDREMAEKHGFESPTQATAAFNRVRTTLDLKGRFPRNPNVTKRVRRSRFTEQEYRSLWNDVEAGMSNKDISAKHQVSINSLSTLKKAAVVLFGPFNSD